MKRLMTTGITAFLLASVGANAGVTEDSESARVALAAGDYKQVVDLSKKISQTSPEMVINWYRMAIASARTSDFAQAQKALDMAMKLDPSLSFSTSPERVHKLLLDISKKLKPETTAGISPEVYIEPPDEKPPIATNLVTLTEPVRTLQPLDTNQTIWMVGFVILSLLVASVLAFILNRQFHQRKSNRQKELALKPLEELIEYVRDNSFLLMERLALHGHKDTALFQSLDKSLTVLELESGRARESLVSSNKDVAVADIRVKMTPALKILGKVSPSELHQSALSNALKNKKTLQGAA